jgi:hypothetical protein
MAGVPSRPQLPDVLAIACPLHALLPSVNSLHRRVFLFFPPVASLSDFSHS